MAKILIADDSASFRLMLKSILEEMGHTVIAEATNGVDAVKLYFQLMPEVITLDIEMPGMSGMDAAIKIKKEHPYSKIIMITSLQKEEMVTKAIQVGIKYFLLKPFQMQQVLRIMNRITESGELAQTRKMEQYGSLYSRQKINLQDDAFKQNKKKGIIQIIDDSKTVLHSLSSLLTELGYTVLTAETGEKGIELVKAGQPDVVLLDINMPQMDGFEVLKILSKNQETKEIPVAILTSDTRKDFIVEAMKFGILDYISKRTSKNILHTKIQSIMEYSFLQKKKLDEKKIYHVQVIRNLGKTIISFKSPLNDDREVKSQLHQVFNPGFISMTSKDIIIFDFHLLPKMKNVEIKKVIELIALFNDRIIFIIAGKSYISFAGYPDFPETAQLYISMGDLLLYLENKINDKSKSQ